MTLRFLGAVLTEVTCDDSRQLIPDPTSVCLCWSVVSRVNLSSIRLSVLKRPSVKVCWNMKRLYVFWCIQLITFAISAKQSNGFLCLGGSYASFMAVL